MHVICRTEDDFRVHGEPQRIEDVFQLAMTYNSEPKEASVAKIRKYITDYYNSDLNLDKSVSFTFELVLLHRFGRVLIIKKIELLYARILLLIYHKVYCS